MKIILFIFFNLVTTYNTYAYTCSEIINTSQFNDIKFRFDNVMKQTLNEFQKTELGIVEYYKFDKISSYFRVDKKDYDLDSCISFKRGTVIFEYQHINVLEIAPNGVIRRHI